MGAFLRQNYFYNISECIDYREYLFIVVWKIFVKHCFVVVSTKMYETDDLKTVLTVPFQSKVVATTASHCMRYVVIPFSQLCEVDIINSTDR